MKNWTKKAAAVGLSLSLVFAVGCTEGKPKEVKAGEKVIIYSTLAPQADFAKEIGKDKVEVNTMIPLGVNFWQLGLTLAEQKTLDNADMLLLNGAGVEDRWFDQTNANLKLSNPNIKIVDTSQGLETLKLLKFINPDVSEADRKKERVDPYFYMDPQNAKKEVDTILAAMIQKAPDYEADFKKNAEAYKKKLDQLDAKYADGLSKVKHKDLISSYPAFQYMTKRYGLSYYVPEGLAVNDFPEENTKENTDLTAELKKHDSIVVYFPEQAAPRVAEFLGAAGLMAAHVNVFEGKQPEKEYKGYIGAMEENLGKFVQGLNVDELPK